MGDANRVMFILSQFGEMSIYGFRDKLNLSKEEVTKIVKLLEKEGLVWTDSKSYSLSTTVYLTNKGREF